MKPGQPSATAMLVAASVARRGTALGLPAVAVQLAERALALGAAQGAVLAMLASHRPGRWLLAAIEQGVLPGLADHHCARKAWLWQCLQQPPILERAIVWVGVGFDGLGRALLLGDSRARIIETDHPVTLRQRLPLVDKQAVEIHAVELPGQLDRLTAICAAQPCTIVCEGVLMYLQPRAVLRALRALAALPVPPRLIFSALDIQQAGGRGFNRQGTAVHRWLNRHGEPFRWRARPHRVCDCLAATGYVVCARWDGGGFGEYAIEAEPKLC